MLSNLLENAALLEIVITLFFFLLTVLAGTKAGVAVLEWYNEIKDGRLDTALTFLEAGVIEVYNTVYADFKARGVDGRITATDARALRDKAIAHAISFATREYGKDVVTPVIGAERLHTAVESVIGVVKERQHIPAPPAYKVRSAATHGIHGNLPLPPQT